MNKSIYFILIIVCLISCLKNNKRTEEQIKNEIPNGDLSLIKSKANFKIPLINLENTWVYQKEEQFAFPNSSDSFGLRIIFLADGTFLRTETLYKLEEDPWRRSIESIERDMGYGYHVGWGKVMGLPKDINFDVFHFLNQASQQIPNLHQVTEFNLTLVEAKLRDGIEQPVLIFNTWGMENPLGIRRLEALKIPVAINRARYIMTINGEMLGIDNQTSN